MTITARFPGKCTVCGRRIGTGEQIEWDKTRGITAHAKCASGKTAPSQPLAGRTDSVQVPRGRNRRPGSCEDCGAYLQVGEGRLEYCEYDTGCMTHMDESGYHLYCADEVACKAGAAEARKEAAERKAEHERKVAEKVAAESAERENGQAELARLTADLVCSGGCYVMPETTDRQGEVIARWTDGWWARSLVRYTLTDGTAIVVANASGYDDFRETLYGPRPVVEAAWLAWAAQCGVTREKADEFLTKYRGCSGTEAYEFIAALPPGISGGSQAWTRRDIMIRAHEIARTCEGDYAARLSLGLRQAWQESRRALAA